MQEYRTPSLCIINFYAISFCTLVCLVCHPQPLGCASGAQIRQSTCAYSIAIACNIDLSLEDTGSSLKEEDTAIYPLYVAKCDFVATGSGMLSFAGGNLLFIMNKEGNWWYGRIKHSGKEGYVPSKYLELCSSLYSYG